MLIIFNLLTISAVFIVVALLLSERLSKTKPKLDPRVHLNSFALRHQGEDQDLTESTPQANVILYSHETLKEDGDSESDLPWEVIMVQAHHGPFGQEEPMTPETLMENHFGGDGGTDTKMSPSKFAEALEKCWSYWRNKEMLNGKHSYWTISNEDLVSRTEQALAEGDWSPGYRDGVILAHIKVNPGEFFSPVIELQEGDQLRGEYKARRPGETPRKSYGVFLDQVT